MHRRLEGADEMGKGVRKLSNSEGGRASVSAFSAGDRLSIFAVLSRVGSTVMKMGSHTAPRVFYHAARWRPGLAISSWAHDGASRFRKQS